MRRALALLAALPLALAPRPAAPADGPRPIRHGVAVDGAVTAVALSAWISTELAKPVLAPARCRWCEPNALDAAAREATVWSAPARARRASDVLAFGLVPAGVAAHQLLAARRAGDAREGLVDVLVVAEAVALTADLTQAVKFAAGRQRPRALHAGPGGERGPDDDLSFFSGHTSLACSLVAAAGTVSTLRGYPSAPWLWGAGGALAASVGWLRMAGDAHWLTDVVTGAAVGTILGVGLPRLLHGRTSAPAAAGSPATGAPALGVALAF
jgi:membrane-associated phospholipid phosphatase